MPDSPASIAMDDQLYAAGAHAARWLEETGRGSGVKVPADQEVRWQRDAVAAMKAATADGTLDCCDHLRAGLEPVVVHAERPWLLLCRSCHVEAMAGRTCLDCGRPAGTSSLLGGVEEMVRSAVAVYSRVRCHDCQRQDNAVSGTFGPGRGSSNR
ncbi:hypothetical protein [Kitasatospora sp. NPDC057223]|uniref:hypothetical protein n=1 Tax=Kitasatospora sp. NPDC057223 TaxID=3346055 RepID=UPI00363FA0C4